MSESKIKKFDHKVFGELRILIIDEEELFRVSDVTNALGYSNGRDALARHVDAEEVGKYDTPTSGGIQKVTYVNESGVYSLIFGSKLPNAKVYKKWVFSEVLPTIRGGGGYIDDVDLLMDRFYSHLDEHTKLVIKSGLIFQRDNQHKINFADDVSEVTNLQSVNEVAKVFGTGRNKFFKLLREEEILMLGNLPYQRYVDQGYFEVKQVTKCGKIYSTTLVTGKGCLWLHKKLGIEVL